MSADLVLTPHHPSFPIGVRAMARPPEQLWVRGRLPADRSVAIVGSRRATAPAMQFARWLAAQAARAGWSIWSGGAVGIDTAAHEGALEAGGVTVVVMGTGFDHLYPTCNRALFDTIVDQGAWLSAYPPHQRGAKWTFLLRNELLASLVSDVVVVQAPAQSGARSTAAAGRRMGKRVWAVPASPWDHAGLGCLAEIEAGASILTNAAPFIGRAAKARPPSLGNLTTPERAVVEAVSLGPACLDVICERSGLRVSDAASAALTLTLKRVLLESADGSYRLNR